MISSQYPFMCTPLILKDVCYFRELFVSGKKGKEKNMSSSHAFTGKDNIFLQLNLHSSFPSFPHLFKIVKTDYLGSADAGSFFRSARVLTSSCPQIGQS